MTEKPRIVRAPALGLLRQVATREAGRWALDTETDGLLVRGPGSPHAAHWIGLGPAGSPLVFIWGPGEFGAEERAFVEGLPLVGQNLRFDLHAADLTPRQTWVDTMNMKYFMGTTALKGLDHQAAMYGMPKIATPDAIKKGRLLEMPDEAVMEYLADDVFTTGIVYHSTIDKYEAAAPAWEWDLEATLYAMERRGVRVLRDRLHELRREVQATEQGAARRLRELGFTGSPASPAQVAAWLTDECGYTLPKTDKGAPSTATPGLEEIGGFESEAIVAWRKAYKLRTAFMDTLPNFIRPTGLVHCDLRSASTSTGRLSCAEPNLQQIPKRSEVGKVFRRCFTGPSGSVTVADYSQMEMRVAAALSGDPILLEIFAEGKDLHDEVARQVGGQSEVSGDDRVKAKAINFGILNGMKPKRLAHQMTSMTGYAQTYTYDEAKRFYDGYRQRFHVLAEWMDATWAGAAAEKLVFTEAGRLRGYGDFDSKLSAVSVRVQGTAAEVVRVALVRAEQAGLLPILQVHDEILCDGAGQAEALSEVMEAAAHEFPALRSVRFAVDAEDNETWGA